MPRTTTAILKDADRAVERSRYPGVCDRMLVGLVILTVVRASEALAGEQVPPTVNSTNPEFNAPRQLMLPSASTSVFVLPLPPSYQANGPGLRTLPTAEFRPRGRSLLEKDSPIGDADMPMLRGTTVWQRLSDYRSRDRVRVVTLWETAGSSVSLQAGRKGNPSLQWTSRLMNRGGATRGLLDQVLSTSLGGVVRGLHLTPHSAGTDAFGRPSKPMEGVLGNAGAGAK